MGKESDGEVIFMRYADDLIVGFEKQSDAKQYLEQLPERLGKFNLRLAEEKSSLVKFNRWEPQDSGKFTFLGYDFYWAPTQKNPNKRVVKRKTNKKKYRASLKAMSKWIKESRSWPLRMILSSLRRRLRGYWNYYCVIANSKMTGRYLQSRTRTDVQMAKPPQSAKELHVGEVQRTLERRLEDPAPTSRGEVGSPAPLPEGDAACRESLIEVKQEK